MNGLAGRSTGATGAFGAFVAVTGPSGSGKDTILDLVREHYADRADAPVFARRDITRQAASGERHRPCDPAEFRAIQAGGGYALAWTAHGLEYGIPATTIGALERGRTVIANVSRGVIADLHYQFARAFTVLVTVSPEVRAARIAQRGREDRAQARARLARPDPAPTHSYDLTILNDAAPEDAAAQLIGFLEQVSIPLAATHHSPRLELT